MITNAIPEIQITPASESIFRYVDVSIAQAVVVCFLFVVFLGLYGIGVLRRTVNVVETLATDKDVDVDITKHIKVTVKDK